LELGDDGLSLCGEGGEVGGLEEGCVGELLDFVVEVEGCEVVGLGDAEELPRFGEVGSKVDN
jgi:hypothetical protein